MRPKPAEMLDPRARQVWQIQGAIKTVVLAVVLGLPAAGAILLFGWPGWITAVAGAMTLAYGILEIAIMPRWHWKRWRYAVTGEEIDLQRGVWFVKRTLVPMPRVQHVDTRQGIIMRRYGLASVNVSTAAGTHEIPALAVETADQLRDRISQQAKVYDHEL